MSDLNVSKPQPEDSVDVFNMRVDSQAMPTSDETENAAQDPAALEVKKAGLAGKLSNLRPMHFGVLGALATAVWIAWPFVFGASGEVNRTTPHVLTPSAAMTQATAERRAEVSTTPATTVAESVQPMAASAVTAVAAQVTAAASVPAAQAVPQSVPLNPKDGEPHSQSLQAQIDALKAQLALTQSQAASAQSLAARCPAKVSSVPPDAQPRIARHSRRSVAAISRNATDRPADLERDTAVGLQDFQLNTVYREQAWIQTSQKTYVVQAGDIIEGVRIERVDPVARSVVTSRGVIR
jgi:hypothetical protein